MKLSEKGVLKFMDVPSWNRKHRLLGDFFEPDDFEDVVVLKSEEVKILNRLLNRVKDGILFLDDEYEVWNKIIKQLEGVGAKDEV